MTKLTNEKENYAIKVTNMKTYMHDLIEDDIRDFQSGNKIKSGYPNIDDITNIYPGLYVIGAISSLGKTTFTHQMAEQIAASGEHVIFFSLEQSTLELATKSIARITAKTDINNARTAISIRKNGIDECVTKAIEQYDSYSNNVTIVECSFRATLKDIEDYVNEFIKTRKIKPVVIVDYLQVIQSDEKTASTKEMVDMHIRRLKQLQSDNKIVLIVISSLNRQNYLTQIDFESFKESGGIEYTADVIWGLQLSVLHDEIFDSQSNINTKRECVREAKKALPRKVELVCLKNRFGISSYSCMFDYYAQYDYFVPTY